MKETKKRIQELTKAELEIMQVKRYLADKGVPVRLTEE